MGSLRRNIKGSTCGNLSSTELIMAGDLPEWMLYEVFIRLPVKVLFKFKVVSKQWHSIISDPSFARMYVARTSLSPNPQHWILISCFTHKLTIDSFCREKLSLHGCSFGMMNRLDHLMLPSFHEVHELHNLIVGISNGLVLNRPLMENHCEGRIYSYTIYNPITKQWIMLPPHKQCFKYVFTGFVSRVEDNVLKSYRVIRIDASINCRVIRFEIYFSEICEWVYYTAEVNQVICFNKRKTAVVDNILHWIIRGHIMAMDPYNKPDSISLISLPVDSGGSERDKNDSHRILFDEHQGRLRYFELSHRSRPNKFFLSLWELTEYHSGEWCLRHRVIFDEFRCNGGRSIFPVPFVLHPFDSNIVYMVDNEVFLSYDIKTRELKPVEHCLPYCWPYYLFVIPQWPVSISSSTFEVTKD